MKHTLKKVLSIPKSEINHLLIDWLYYLLFLLEGVAMHVPIFLHVCFVCFHLRNGAVVTKEEVRWNKRYKEYETIL